MGRLYTQTLIMEGTQLTLYQAVGEPVVWHMEKQEAAVLQQTLEVYNKVVVR